MMEVVIRVREVNIQLTNHCLSSSSYIRLLYINRSIFRFIDVASFFTASSYLGSDSRNHTRSSSFDNTSLYPTINTITHDDDISVSTSNRTIPSSLYPSTYTGSSRNSPLSLVNSSPNSIKNEKDKGDLNDSFIRRSNICLHIFLKLFII